MFIYDLLYIQFTLILNENFILLYTHSRILCHFTIHIHGFINLSVFLLYQVCTKFTVLWKERTAYFTITKCLKKLFTAEMFVEELYQFSEHIPLENIGLQSLLSHFPGLSTMPWWTILNNQTNKRNSWINTEIECFITMLH